MALASLLNVASSARERGVEFWHYRDEDDPNWEDDFSRGHEIGVLITLLSGAIVGMILSLANAFRLIET